MDTMRVVTASLRTPWLESRRAAWRARAQQPGDLLYVALGDSAAQGVGTGDLDASYVGLIAARLQRHTGRSVQVVNLSRYGARVRDVVAEQLPQLAELSPDLLTVTAGANDMRRFDRGEFGTDLELLLGALPSHAIVADLPCFHFGPRELDAVIASRMIADRVRAHRLSPAPLHRVTEFRRGWGSLPDFAWDQFHPSAKGYRVWESAFAGAVTRRAAALGASPTARR
jgi:lysophospholipase L1-like esterase